MLTLTLGGLGESRVTSDVYSAFILNPLDTRTLTLPLTLSQPDQWLASVPLSGTQSVTHFIEQVVSSAGSNTASTK